ncbi:unnamed protein product [Blepharisma stoltei]|uniref:Secreted protein n=1 Tax=Blepharisma stoltei TaxID=1481888 RepID=A0AAU9IS36_9CILI|nr:unnamed protein product [Blepharisma stoltei]
MVFLIFLLSFVAFDGVSSSSIVSVFPPRYSQFFDTSTDECDVTLTEAFLSGEENEAKFGLSLWIKVESYSQSGYIFTIDRRK